MDQPSKERHGCHCGKSFFRKEHLRRHQATHGSRSFVCQVCQKAFTRNDLLRRHVGLHESAVVPDTRKGRACDACHENKTKCGGGKRCSLCVKRGIDCTYSRKGISKPKEASITLDHSSQTIPPSPRSPRSGDQNAENRQRPHQDLFESSTSDVSFPNEPPTPPSISAAENIWQEQDSHPARVGLEAILRAVSIPRSGSKEPPVPPATNEYKGWLDSCVQKYFDRVHERWPLIQHQIFDINTDPAMLVASIVMVGSWFRDPEHLRGRIIKIHNAIVAQLLEYMAEPAEMFSPEKAWPADALRALMLNVVFALETGRTQLISRARVLHGIAIASMRELGMFTTEGIERHEQAFFPGSFPPWLHSGRERWKRIVYCSFKLETYMSLLRIQPPAIHREELNLGLLAYFSTWNAHGIDVFFKRQPNELGRPLYTMSNLSKSSVPFLPIGLMVEDIEIGLCGMWYPLWNFAQERRAGVSVAPLDSASEENISHQLNMWKFQLNGLESSIQSPEGPARVECLNHLLRAYSGKEQPGTEDWEQPVLHRISSFILGAKMLYYLLSINLLVDIRILNQCAYGQSTAEEGSTQTAEVTREQRSWLEHWCQTPQSRQAVLNALFILALYEESSLLAEARDESLNPIFHMALSAGAAVLWTWLTNIAPVCTCMLGSDHSDVGLNIAKGQMTTALEAWVRNGGGILASGVPLCLCEGKLWMDRVTAALDRGGRVWEMNASQSRLLSTKFRDSCMLAVSDGGPR